MSFSWFVFGDLGFLADILNAVAAIMAGVGTGGSTDYTGLLGLVALLGFFAMMLKGALNGGAVPYHHILIPVVVVGLLFAPKASVTMENVYTGQTRTVANVPFGVAATGAVLSRIGFVLTDMTETAFSYPGLTDEGFAAALNTWKTIRSISAFPETYSSANRAGGGDFRRSWVNYVSTCTNFGLEIGPIRQSTLSSAPLAHEALKFDNGAYGAEIFIGGNVGQTFSCAEAHERLLRWSRTAFIPALKRDVLASKLFDPARDAVISPAVVDARMTALLAIFDTPFPPDEVLLSIFVGQLVDHGMMRRLQLDNKEGYAIALADAIRQRNAQWMAQGSIFETFARPLTAFVEGFFYAMAPIVLVATMIGQTGFRVVGRYALIGLWFQFWMPTLAVINLFVLHTVADDITGLENSGIAFTSLGGQFSADDVVQQYLGVAGMFAASVPALSMLLITGSSYAFANLADKAGGPDTFNEKLAARPTLEPAPIARQLPDLQVSPLQGQHVTDSERVLPSFNVFQNRSNAISTAERTLEGERLQFSEAFDQALSRSQGAETRSTSGTLWRSSEAAQRSEAYRAAQASSLDEFYSEAASAGLTRTQATDLAVQYGLSGSFGTGVSRFLGGGVNGGGSVANRDGDASTSAIDNRLQSALKRGFSEDRDLSASITDGLARDVSNGVQQSGYSASSFTATEALRREAAEYSDAQRSLEQARSETVGTGMSREMRPLDVAEWVRQTGSMPDFKRFMMNHGLSGQASQFASGYIASGAITDNDVGHDQAYVVGGLEALYNNGMLDKFEALATPHGLRPVRALDFGMDMIAAGPRGPDVSVRGGFSDGAVASAGGYDPSGFDAIEGDGGGVRRFYQGAHDDVGRVGEVQREAYTARMDAHARRREEMLAGDADPEKDFWSGVRERGGDMADGLGRILDGDFSGIGRDVEDSWAIVTGDQAHIDRRLNEMPEAQRNFQRNFEALNSAGASEAASELYARLSAFQGVGGAEDEIANRLEGEIRAEWGDRPDRAEAVIRAIRTATENGETASDGEIAGIGAQYDSARLLEPQ